jgi:hypothetical protein
MMWRMPGTASFGGGPGRRGCACAALALSEVTETITLRPSATPDAACCAASRTGPKAGSMPGATEIANATAPEVTMISESPP